MKTTEKPAWLRLTTDGFVIAAIVVGAVYALSSQAGASEDAPLDSSISVEDPASD